MLLNLEYLPNVKAAEGRPQLAFDFPEGTDPFSLFQISLENYFDIKFRLWEEFKLDISNMENWPFYEYQLFMEKLNDKIEKENKKNASHGMSEAFSFDRKSNPILNQNPGI